MWGRFVDRSSLRFQSTRPVKDATFCYAKIRSCDWVSIHASREGRDERLRGECEILKVSIHASREGRDPVWCDAGVQVRSFNPRVP